MKMKLLAVLATGLFAFNLPGAAFADTFQGIPVNLEGSAQLLSSNLVLNDAGGQSGAAWAVNSISTTNSFYTIFSFDLQNQHLSISTMADGVAFVLQGKSNTALGGGGASIGAGGIDNVVGSAIQTWENKRLGLFQGDPSDLFSTKINPAPFDMGNAD